MGWTRFDLDHHAQRIVLAARKRDLAAHTDKSEMCSLNQAHKMRTSCAFGLERFWGEHLRLKLSDSKVDKNKAEFIADTWEALTVSLLPKEIQLPREVLKGGKNKEEDQKLAVDLAEEFAAKIWRFNENKYDRSVALAILTNLCDAIIWWKQRLKTAKGD